MGVVQRTTPTTAGKPTRQTQKPAASQITEYKEQEINYPSSKKYYSDTGWITEKQGKYSPEELKKTNKGWILERRATYTSYRGSRTIRENVYVKERVVYDQQGKPVRIEKYSLGREGDKQKLRLDKVIDESKGISSDYRLERARKAYSETQKLEAVKKAKAKTPSPTTIQKEQSMTSLVGRAERARATRARAALTTGLNPISVDPEVSAPQKIKEEMSTQYQIPQAYEKRDKRVEIAFEQSLGDVQMRKYKALETKLDRGERITDVQPIEEFKPSTPLKKKDARERASPEIVLDLGVRAQRNIDVSPLGKAYSQLRTRGLENVRVVGRGAGYFSEKTGLERMSQPARQLLPFEGLKALPTAYEYTFPVSATQFGAELAIGYGAGKTIGAGYKLVKKPVIKLSTTIAKKTPRVVITSPQRQSNIAGILSRLERANIKPSIKQPMKSRILINIDKTESPAYKIKLQTLDKAGVIKGRKRAKQIRISKVQQRKVSLGQAYDPRISMDVQKGEAVARIRTKGLKDVFVKERRIRVKQSGEQRVVDVGLRTDVPALKGTGTISSRVKKPSTSQSLSRPKTKGRLVSLVAEQDRGVRLVIQQEKKPMQTIEVVKRKGIKKPLYVSQRPTSVRKPSVELEASKPVSGGQVLMQPQQRGGFRKGQKTKLMASLKRQQRQRIQADLPSYARSLEYRLPEQKTGLETKRFPDLSGKPKQKKKLYVYEEEYSRPSVLGKYESRYAQATYSRVGLGASVSKGVSARVGVSQRQKVSVLPISALSNKLITRSAKKIRQDVTGSSVLAKPQVLKGASRQLVKFKYGGRAVKPVKLSRVVSKPRKIGRGGRVPGKVVMKKPPKKPPSLKKKQRDEGGRRRIKDVSGWQRRYDFGGIL